MHGTLKESTENIGVDQRRKKRSGWRCTRHRKKSLKISESTKDEEWMEMPETLERSH